MAEFHGQGFQNLGLVMVGRDLNIGPRDAPRDSATLLKVRSTDPRDDKARIEQQKGRLLRNSYEWILSHGDFLRWRDGEGYQLLWIRGDPGKGKTMLVCGIINELNEARESGYNIAYFFCQATNFQLRKATFVLQGLIFSLISQQPDLLDFVRDDIDQASSDLFQDLNGWAALCRIFNRLTEETRDADKSLTFWSQLMKWIAGLSSPGIKILVSSRNWPSIESGLSTATQRVALHLELNGEAISNAVDLYIDHKVKGLERPKDLNEETRETIKRHLKSYSNNTFLWVALVCQELDREDTYPWRIDDMLREFPPGLNELYQRMAMYFFASDEAEICREVLAVQTLAYRPLTLTELSSLVKCSEMFAERWLQKVVELCGSFLTVKADTIYFVHQSAKEYLIQNMPKSLFPQGALAAGHRTMVIRSIQTLSKALRENMYQLPSLGSRVDNVTVPSPDPLSGIHYACVYWADHLIDAESIEKRDVDDGKLVRQFLEKHILHWFEALSLLKSLGLGITALTKIMSSIQTSVKGSTGDVTSLVTFESLNSTAESISQRRIHRRIERRHSKRNEKELESPGSGDMKALWNLIYDAWRLIRHHKVGIESAPLQVYSSALIFSPACSLVRQIFLKAPASLPMIQTAGSHWNPCLQALEGHTGPIQSVAFALNGKYMASTSADGTTRIWDATTGECLNILQGHVNDTIKISPSPPWNRAHDPWQSIAFSPNSELLALSSGDGIIQIWDTLMGVWQQTLKDNLSDPSKSRCISGIWQRELSQKKAEGCGALQYRLGHHDTVFTLTKRQSCSMVDNGPEEENFRVEILDISTGQYHETPWHRKQTRPCRVSMSVDGELVIYGPTSYDMFHIRHINADRRMFPETSIRVSNISEFVDVLVLSPDGRFLVAAGYGRVVECEISTGQHAILSRQTGDAEYLSALEYSPDGTLLVSGSRRGLVQVLEMTAFRTQPEWSHTAKHQINLALSTDGNFLGFVRPR
ncbi:hypothetical protein RRF57_001810 [Xylaria bambusicola]|uniref:Nephrocystin 3-like N-terminal domain-containing protein n=1 Tax=Xylaria bambusicola TaxID=326684 RepID=A0AAN7U612_9PEZI